MQWKTRVVFVLVILGGLAFHASASDSLQQKLKEANDSRSSYPQRFLELMRQLQEDDAKLSGIDRQRFEYLLAYKTGVYDDQPGRGVKLAESLFNKTKDIDLKYRAGSLAVSFSAVDRNFSPGLRFLEKTLPLRTKVTDKNARHDGLAAAAMFYNQLRQYQIGLRYANEVLLEQPSQRMSCVAGLFRAESLYNLGKLASGDKQLQSVIRQCTLIHEYIPANFVRATLAHKLVDEGKQEKALALLEGVLPEVQATRYPRLIAEIRSILADLKLKQGDLKSAEIHALATVSLGEAVKSSASVASAYSVLYQISLKRGDMTEALEFYKRYAEADKAYQNDVKARELAYEIVRHETQQQTQQIELLQRNNQVLRLQQTLERESAQKARLAMVFLMLVLAGIIFWALQIKRHQGQLQRLAQTDTLTGLGNRHFFTKKSERALVEAARAGDSAALVMFDLDHFKAINDTYGHGAGDWVLKQVGKTCSTHCRKVDYLGRIGGEEFAVLLNGLDLADATRLAEDCRSQLAQIDTRECGYSFVVTASFGVSSTAQSGYDLSRLLSHADQMLYRAKNEGRNRVCAYTAETAADYKTTKRSPTLSVVSG